MDKPLTIKSANPPDEKRQKEIIKELTRFIQENYY